MRVSSSITDLQRDASETRSASSQVFSAAQSLSGDSNRLKLEVGKFLKLGKGSLMRLLKFEADCLHRRRHHSQVSWM